MSQTDLIPVIIIMGVSGSGKTTLANLLAKELGGLEVIEGDTLHTQQAREKMRAGIPLSDQDRWPWLDRIHQVISEPRDQTVIVTCSALRRSYRERLSRGLEAKLMFLFLDAPRQVLVERLASREHEYMPASLLESQLETLERPTADEPVVRVPVENDINQTCQALIRAVKIK
ncbi:MAG: gluconokinase [Pseudomonadota bacterium]|jgi:gluconokinase